MGALEGELAAAERELAAAKGALDVLQHSAAAAAASADGAGGAGGAEGAEPRPLPALPAAARAPPRGAPPGEEAVMQALRRRVLDLEAALGAKQRQAPGKDRAEADGADGMSPQRRWTKILQHRLSFMGEEGGGDEIAAALHEVRRDVPEHRRSSVVEARSQFRGTPADCNESAALPQLYGPDSSLSLIVF